MGYILPVNSYRSQQYASRLMGNDESYSKIAQLQHVHKIGDFMEEIEESINEEKPNFKMNKENDPLAVVDFRSQVAGYINPNPAYISVNNHAIVSKGAVINAYV